MAASAHDIALTEKTSPRPGFPMPWRNIVTGNKPDWLSRCCFCQANTHTTASSSMELCSNCARIDFEAAFDQRAWDGAAQKRHYVYLQDLRTRSDWEQWQAGWDEPEEDTLPLSNCWLCQNLLRYIFDPRRSLHEGQEDCPLTHLTALDRWHPFQGSGPRSESSMWGMTWPTRLWVPKIDEDIETSAHHNALYISVVGVIPTLLDTLIKYPVICSKSRTSRAPTFLEPRLTPHFVDMNLVKAWINSCAAYHPYCSDSQLLPTPRIRLIDCERRRIVQANESMAYTALSYVWGAKSIQSSYQSDGGLGTLPKTIEDAITVTKALGYRYLWVDRYCIKQDDQVDKMEQIQLMDQIYERTALAIIAAAGTDDEYGIPGIQGTRDQESRTWGSLTFSAFVEPDQEIASSVWNSRGWTFQEGILPHRRLIFTEFSVSFTCLKSKAHDHVGCSEHVTSKRAMDVYDEVMYAESLTGSPDADILPSDDNTASLVHNLGRFKQAVEQYSKRKLSYQEDVFRGFCGIAKKYEEAKVPVLNIFGIPFVTAEYRAENERTAELGVEGADQAGISSGISCRPGRIAGLRMSINPLSGLPRRGLEDVQIEELFSSALGWQGARADSSQQSGEPRDLFPSWSWGNFMGEGASWLLGLPRGKMLLHPVNIRLQVDEKARVYTLHEFVSERREIPAMPDFRTLHMNAFHLTAEAFLDMTRPCSSRSIQLEWDNPTSFGAMSQVLMSSLSQDNISGKLSPNTRKHIFQQVSAGNCGIMLLGVENKEEATECADFLVLRLWVTDGLACGSRVGLMRLWRYDDVGIESLFFEHGIVRTDVQLQSWA